MGFYLSYFAFVFHYLILIQHISRLQSLKICDLLSLTKRVLKSKGGTRDSTREGHSNYYVYRLSLHKPV
jgi:hypothetical protein